MASAFRAYFVDCVRCLLDLVHPDDDVMILLRGRRKLHDNE